VLTADLASVRRRGDELRLVPVDARARARVAELAAAYQVVARGAVGAPRDDVEARLREIAVPAADRRLGAAVRKLVRDGCVFEEATAADAAALRGALFRRASAGRSTGGPFDRAAHVDAVARERGTTPDDVERALFADRAGAQRLLAVEAASPERVAAGFELAQAQAVLLRAARVTAIVRTHDAATYRHLFRRLKFLRLLPLIAALPEGGYRLEIDGPFSLFQAVTRYGLQLALALPAIAACDTWSVDADVRWGADRRPLHFRIASEPAAAPAARAAARDAAIVEPAPPPLPDGIDALVASFEALGTPWRVDRDPAILDLPGVGLCVPDLTFERTDEGRVVRVHLEVLGFWSREAVWRRVDLVRGGLPHRILFAVSRDLRVSEDVLHDVPSGALYVFTRTPSARAILKHVEALAR
jgi:predicted nuclease of restriction endonuclease-like RecB superfamily